MKKVFVVFISAILIASFLLLSCNKSTPTYPVQTITPLPTRTATVTPVVSATITRTSTEVSTSSSTPTITATVTATITVTMTSTPNYGTLSGNLVLPAAQNGVIYTVLVDTDMNFANGINTMIMGLCGSSASVPYSLTITPGSYYVYALVKTAGCAECPPEAGDYLGWLGAVYPANPAAANTVITANNTLSGQNINMVQAVNNVYGSVITSTNCDTKNILIAADTDADPAAGVFYLKVAPVSGTTGIGPYYYSYGALCYFPGSFYFTALIASNGHALPGAPEPGDFAGNTGAHTIDPAVSNGPFDITTILMP